MLKSLKEMSGFTLLASDGEIGTVDDFYFEEGTWKIRYTVVDTGRWLPGRRIILSPLSIGRPDWENKRLPVALSRATVEGSPDVPPELPIQRADEEDLHKHYLWEPYWIPGLGGVIETVGGPVGPIPMDVEDVDEEEPAATPDEAPPEPRLYAATEMLGFDILSTDGSIGHLEDFLLDDMSWTLRWLVVDTGVWIQGKKALIPTSWVAALEHAAATIQLDLPKELIQSSPAYEPGMAVSPQLEEELFAHYRRAA